jgi:O-antigen/teichoic acid export membrane protein
MIRLASSVLTGLTVFAVGRLVGPNAFGEASLVLSIAMMVGSLLSIGVINSILRFASWESLLRQRFVWMVLLTTALSALVSGAVCFAVGAAAMHQVVGAIILGATITFSICCSAYLITKGEFVGLAFTSFGATVTSAVSVAVGRLLSLNEFDIALSYYLVFWSANALALSRIARRHYRVPCPGQVQEPLPDFWVFFRNAWWSNAAQLIVLRVDSILLGVLASPAALSRYVLMLKVGEALASVIDSRAALVAGSVPSLKPAEALEFTRRQSKIAATFSITGGLAGSLLFALAVPLLLGNEFGLDRWWSLLLIPAMLALATGSVFSSYFAVLGNLKPTFVASLFGLLLAVPMYFFLIPNYGVAGAVSASAAVYLAQAGYLFWSFSSADHPSRLVAISS